MQRCAHHQSNVCTACVRQSCGHVAPEPCSGVSDFMSLTLSVLEKFLRCDGRHQNLQRSIFNFQNFESARVNPRMD
eukprot:1842822-Amphidinium_carterae.2